MIEEQAEVTRVNGSEVWVETQRRSACGSCSASGGCGTSVLAKVLGNRSRPMRVVCSVEVAQGDQVVIAINDAALVRGSLAVYLVPLLGILLGALLGEWWAEQLGATSELYAILGAIVGIGLGLLWLRRFTQRISNDLDYQPVVLRRI